MENLNSLPKTKVEETSIFLPISIESIYALYECDSDSITTKRLTGIFLQTVQSCVGRQPICLDGVTSNKPWVYQLITTKL